MRITRATSSGGGGGTTTSRPLYAGSDGASNFIRWSGVPTVAVFVVGVIVSMRATATLVADSRELTFDVQPKDAHAKIEHFGFTFADDVDDDNEGDEDEAATTSPRGRYTATWHPPAADTLNIAHLHVMGPWIRVVCFHMRAGSGRRVWTRPNYQRKVYSGSSPNLTREVRVQSDPDYHAGSNVTGGVRFTQGPIYTIEEFFNHWEVSAEQMVPHGLRVWINGRPKSSGWLAEKGPLVPRGFILTSTKSGAAPKLAQIWRRQATRSRLGAL